MQPFEPQQLPITDIPWDSLIPLIGRATRSLAYYDGILYGLANPDRPPRKARAIIDLYNSLKSRIIDLTHSQYAVPLLDCLFDQPVFTSSRFDDCPGMPSKPMIMNMLGRTEECGDPQGPAGRQWAQTADPCFDGTRQHL